MRRNNKEEIVEQISEKEPQSLECCMCGDYGLILELFRCKVCKNKSQHRYCSTEYPKADSYEICNWCLSRKNYTVDKMEDTQIKVKVGRGSGSSGGGGDDDRPQKSPKGEKNRGSLMKLKLINNDNKAIKKTKSSSPQRSPKTPPAGEKTSATGVADIEERLRRTRSESALQRSNSTIIRKHVLKNKVRRYKLLAEVSC